MLKVYIKPSSIHIYPYSLRLCYQLEKTLSVWDNYSKKYTSFLYDFEEEENSNVGILRIPRGIGIDTVEECLNKAGLSYKVIDDTMVYPSPKRINFNVKYESRSEEQEQGIDHITNKTTNQAMLALDVGRGKTFCAVKSINRLKMSAMIISYNLSKQWCDRLTEYTNLVSGTDIVTVIGSSYFNDVLNGDIKPKASIYIVSLSTLISFMKLYGRKSLQDLVDKLGIGIKIFDEAHNRYLQFNAIDLNMQVCKTIYLTATPGRSIKPENKMFSKIYSNVDTYGSFNDISNDHYTIQYVDYDSHSTAKDRVGFKTIRGLSSTRYERYFFDKYNKAIPKLLINEFIKPVLSESTNKRKVLIVTDWLQDIQFLKDYFSENNKEYSVGTYCLLVKNKDLKEEQLKKDIIIGTIGSMQNGKDIEGLKAIIALTQYSSPIVSRQLLGRLRPLKNEKVYYFDLVDISVHDIIKQRRDRNVIFEPRNNGFIENRKISFDDYL